MPPETHASKRAALQILRIAPLCAAKFQRARRHTVGASYTVDGQTAPTNPCLAECSSPAPACEHLQVNSLMLGILARESSPTRSPASPERTLKLSFFHPGGPDTAKLDHFETLEVAADRAAL